MGVGGDSDRGYSLQIIALVLLLVGVVIAAAFYRQAPWLCPGAAWINFIGCVAIKTTPDVPNRVFQFVYMHSVDIAIIVFAHLFAVSEWKKQRLKGFSSGVAG